MAFASTKPTHTDDAFASISTTNMRFNFNKSGSEIIPTEWGQIKYTVDTESNQIVLRETDESGEFCYNIRRGGSKTLIGAGAIYNEFLDNLEWDGRIRCPITDDTSVFGDDKKIVIDISPLFADR